MDSKDPNLLIEALKINDFVLWFGRSSKQYIEFWQNLQEEFSKSLDSSSGSGGLEEREFRWTDSYVLEVGKEYYTKLNEYFPSKIPPAAVVWETLFHWKDLSSDINDDMSNLALSYLNKVAPTLFDRRVRVGGRGRVYFYTSDHLLHAWEKIKGGSISLSGLPPYNRTIVKLDF